MLLIGVERVLLRRLGAERDPACAAVLFFGLAAMLLLPLAAPWRLHDWSVLRLALPTGLLYAAAYWLYVGALTVGQVSATAPLGALAGVLLLPLAHRVYGEALGPAKLLGAGCIAAGAAALQSPPRRGRSAGDGRGQRVASVRMLGYAVLGAITRLADRAAARGVSAHALAYAWVVFSTVTLGQLLLLAWRGQLAELAALARARPLLALWAGSCNAASFLALLGAMARLPVSLVEPVSALSLLVSAALAALWLREPLRARWLPTVAVVVGSALLVREAAPLPAAGGG